MISSPEIPFLPSTLGGKNPSHCKDIDTSFLSPGFCRVNILFSRLGWEEILYRLSCITLYDPLKCFLKELFVDLWTLVFAEMDREDEDGSPGDLGC